MYEWQAIKQMKSETINEVSKDVDWHLVNGCKKCKCNCRYVETVQDIANHILEVRKSRPSFGLVK